MNFDSVRFISGLVSIDDLSIFLNSLNSFSQISNIKIQGFDARKIIDTDHLLFSIQRARSAFENGENEAKDIGLEVLRFSSGQRKIDKSFSIGLIQGENRSIFVFFGESEEQLENAENAFKTEFELKVCADLTIEEKKPFLMKQFGITEEELSAVGENRLKDLIMERVALVDVTR